MTATPEGAGRTPGDGARTTTTTRIRNAERCLLAALRECGHSPRIAGLSRTLSRCGEHGGIWLAAGLTAAAADPVRRPYWLRSTALIGTAHLSSMVLKRVVRRPRPLLPGGPLVGTAGRHSFPSSHAASAAAAAVLFGRARPRAAGAAAAVSGVAALMCVSRMVVGVHYPSDVGAGMVLGGLAAHLGLAGLRKERHG